jgi:hypothetical protein
MVLDALKSDGKTDATPSMTPGSGFAASDGKAALPVLVSGDAWEAFFKFRELMATMVDNPALEALNNTEIRMFKSYRILLDMAGAMSTETMRQHVLAHWRASKEGVLKLPIGAQAEALIKIIDGGLGVR